ncbi:MAG: HEAT repeat domain-containing protein [Anaerolineae bacterium]|nr:HEAT repeat domain-containing protein [Anaerolineae bacterium]
MGARDRAARVKSIGAFLEEYESTRMVVTCRQHDYADEIQKILDLDRLVAQPLNNDRIRRFLNAYIRDKARARALWKEIQPSDYAWRDERQRSLLELARNPYLLTIVALIYERDKRLPESTTDLFRQIVTERWLHEAGQKENPEASKVHDFTFHEFTEGLGNLAFAMVDEGASTTVNLAWARKRLRRPVIGRHFLLEPLYPPATRRADDLLRVGEACSVLTITTNQIRFFHQLMQEYFAALAMDWRRGLTISIDRWEMLVMRANMSEAARDEVLVVCIAGLGNTDSRMRWAVANAMSEIRDARAVEPLINALRDANGRVRIAAAHALGRIGDVRAIEPLIVALRDKQHIDSYVEALGLFGEPAVEPLVKVILKTEDASIRQAATEALKLIGKPAASPLIAVLNNANWSVREKALDALIQMGEISVESIVAALHGVDLEMHSFIEDAMHHQGDFADPTTALNFFDVLEDNTVLQSHTRFREILAEALREIGTPEARAALREHGFDA